MIIRYVHISDPDNEKIVDTEKTLQGCRGILSAIGSHPTQQEWDRRELMNAQKKLKEGILLSFHTEDKS